MKFTKTVTFALSFVFAMSLFAAAGEPLGVGSKALLTDNQMQNINGDMLSYADVKGEKGTLLIFSCNHCPWVKGWETRLAEIGNWAQKNGIGVLYINPNDPAAYPEDTFELMKTRAEERGFEFPYVVDAESRMARAYGATKTPEAFLFNSDDVLVYYGAVDDNMRDPGAVEHHWLKDAVEAVANGQEPPVRESKALGCTIRYYGSGE